MSRFVIRLKASGRSVRLEGDQWTGDDPFEVEIAELFARLRPYTAYEPDEGAAAADFVALKMGGEITEREASDHELPPGCVY